MSVTDHWHPSGRTAVYDVEMNLVGHTTMRMEAEKAAFPQTRAGEAQIFGIVLRFLFEAQDAGPRYWSYRVIEGDPAALPGFVALPHDKSR